MPEVAEVAPVGDLATTVSHCARSLYEDARLIPLLRRLMTTSCALTGSVGSSISIVDPPAARYTKVAERGTACRLGQSFPLHEGVTGRVMASRRPVVLRSYREVVAGHLPPESRASEGAVVALPIWWREDIIGASIVFAGTSRSFRTEEIDQLEAITQLVAPGIVVAAGRDLGMAGLFRRPQAEQDRRSGGPDPTSASVAQVALGLASLVHRADLPCQAATDGIGVRVRQDDDGLHLQVRPADARGLDWQELVDGLDGGVRAVVAGVERAGGTEEVGRSTFTAREQEVAELLSQGLSDRAIADVLVISPKTAEKHVGAVLRKTQATTRTAAVVRALQRGWITGAATFPA